MPKPIVNNKVTYQNIYGRIIQYEEFLNQGVRTDDSPTFGSLQLTGDATIEGNLYVEGNTTILDTNVIEFEDNIILINRLESGSGVTLNQAGFEVERGSLENYRFVYNEPDDTFRIGFISNQQAVATREDSPLSNGVMTWNDSAKRLDSTNTISIDMTINSTTNSISSTTGSLRLLGGLGIKKDMHLDGIIYLTGNTHGNKNSIYTNTTSNSLVLSTSFDIELNSNNVKIPYNIPLVFGTTGQRILSNSLNNNLDIYANGNINLTVPFGQRISIPNQIPITFSTTNEKLFADDSNNMILTSSQDVRLTPGAGKKVLIPVNIPLAFNTSSQYISANILNDLNIAANNNIYLTPGNNLNIVLPYDAGIKLGSGGLQRIYANSSNELYIQSTSDLYLNSNSRVKVPVNIPIAFGNNNDQYIQANTFGSLLINAGNNVQIINTTNSLSADTGALTVSGGLGVSKDVFIGGNLTVQGSTVTLNTETILVEDNLIIVNNSPLALADGGLLVKRFSDGLSDTAGNIYAALFYKESTDEFTFAYTNTASNTIVNFSDYIPIRANDIHLMNSIDVTSFSSGSITTLGGGYIHKNLIVGQNITSSSIKVNNSADIAYLNSNISTIGSILITSTENATNLSSGSLIVNGGMSVSKNLLVNENVQFYSTENSSNLTTGSVLLNGGLTIKCSANSNSYTNGGALTIAGGVGIGKDVFINGQLTVSTLGSFNSLVLLSTENSINSSSGSLVSYGGISIQCTTNSDSNTQGGALTIAGGVAVEKDLYIGGQLYVNDVSSGSLAIGNSIHYSGNGYLITLNNTSGSSLWNYVGKMNINLLGYCEIDIYNGINQTSSDLINTLKFTTSINNTNVSYNHNFYGNTTFNNQNQPILYVYKDLLDNYHLFIKLVEYSSANIHMKCNLGDVPQFKYEGNNTLPDGTFSGFNNLTWTEEYNTQKESNLSYQIGNTVIEGSLKTAAHLPIIGYNNINTTSSRDTGLIMKRYQKENDGNLGDIINDGIYITNILPNQSSVSSTQIKLSNSASAVDNYYNGWWIKIVSGTNTGQIRRIVDYNGPLRVAELESPWTLQNPTIGDTVNLYSYSNVTMYYDESESMMKFAYSSEDVTNEISYQNYVDLQFNKLILSGTVPSSNLSTGTLVINGGFSINCTSNSTSLTTGGTLTSLGGGSFSKDLRIGQSVIISDTAFNSSSDLHINKDFAKMSLQYNSGNYAYIDFVESETDNRYGIISDNMMSFTYNNNNNTPNNSSRYLNITTSGNIGINTTSNIDSLLTLNTSNFVSTDSNNGFLGINGGKSNTSGSSLILYGNDHLTNPNDMYLETNSTGSIYFTNDDLINVNISSNGITEFYSDQQSINSSIGSVILNGGLSINNNANSQSATNGGAMTIAGGASIKKDVYIGGNVTVDGNLTAIGVTDTPSLSFSNTQGCSIISYSNCKLIKINNERILSFGITVLPIEDSINCQFQFDIPNKVTNFSNRNDIIISCSGYTDDTELYTLFNTLGVAVPSTIRGLIKFQSASTGLHNLLVMCRYTSN